MDTTVQNAGAVPVSPADAKGASRFVLLDRDQTAAGEICRIVASTSRMIVAIAAPFSPSKRIRITDGLDMPVTTSMV